MPDKLEAMVFSSFLGDSLALPAHWIYDTGEIENRFGRIQKLLAPSSGSYHGSRQAGQFTHYGDQAMVLLKSVAASSGFSLDHFARNWKELFNDYDGYLDHATKATLQNFRDGKGVMDAGSTSTDLAGAARIAPLLYFYTDDLDMLVSSCRSQTAMTHNNPIVVDSAELFARVIWKVLRGASPVSALKEMTEAPADNRDAFREWITEGLESSNNPTRDVIGEFGQSCATRGAFPSVIHLVSRYEDNLAEALVQNVMAGGDSAARGLFVGMILGAHNGMHGIPKEWMAGLKSRSQISELLSSIDAAKGVK